MKSILAGRNSPAYDVIIAGAGPVGLFLACELALAACSVLVVEREEHPHAPLKHAPFGIRGISAPAIDPLYRRGLLEAIELPKRFKSAGAPKSPPGAAPKRQAGHFAGIPFYHHTIDPSQWQYRLPSSPSTNLLTEMAQLETALTRRAQALGVTIRRGLPFTDFQQTADEVVVQAGGECFAGKWLVGCDGGRSAVRKAGGFEFAGTEPEFTGYSILVDIADPEKLSPGRNVTPTGIYVQSEQGYIVVLEFDGGLCHGPGAVTLDHVQQVLQRVSNTDVTIRTLHRATTWTDRARQATTYRNGRVLLAGDAAHIHSPLGGQGLSLGLGDAVNLGWKLAATIQGRAPADLLDTYYTERHPIGAQVLDWSRAQVAIMRPSPHALALHTVVRDLMDTREGATYIAARVWGVFTHYPLAGSHPLVGHSVPNFELEDGTRLGELMHDGRGILLDFGDDAFLGAIASEYGSQISYVSGRAKNQLGLSAALIRPDGIVAWATESTPDYDELQRAAAPWFSRRFAHASASANASIRLVAHA